MRTYIRQPCEICGEQIDEAHEEEHSPEKWLDPPWSALKNVWHAMVMGMDAQMYLVKDEKKILLNWVNHPDYRNSVMYLSYHYENLADYHAIENMLEEDRVQHLFYPDLFMFSIHEVDSTIYDLEQAGYKLEPTED
jgi:hypothetical protein